MTELKNTREEPTPMDWVEGPNVETELHWVRDDDSLYKKQLVNLNGVLMTYEDAKRVRHRLSEITHPDN